MARKPQADIARARFAALLAEHLHKGTRPGAAEEIPWTYAAFAREVGTTRQNAGLSDRSVSNWCKGRSLPEEIAPILRALFGPTNDCEPAREALRLAFIAARAETYTPIITAAQPDPAGVQWVAAGDQFTIDRTSNPTDQTAAADPLRQQLQAAICEAAAELADAAGRVSNTVTWAKLASTAKAFHALISSDPLTLPTRLGEAYAHMLRLGRFLDTDIRVQRDPKAADDPLDSDIHGPLTDLVRLAAPWLRGFPSIAKWDDEGGKALVRPELFQTARDFTRIARETKSIPAVDADEMDLLAEAEHPQDFLGQKAGNRSVGGAQNLMLAAAGMLGMFLSGAVASDFATRSLLVQRAGALLAAAETEVEAVARTLPADLRHALLTIARDGQHVADVILPGPPTPRRPAVIREGPGPEMVLIPAGMFMMGVPNAESTREGDTGWDDRARPLHQVTIARPFWLGRYPVTRGEYAVFAGETGRSREPWASTMFQQDDRHPVVNVSCDDAMAYLAWLSAKTGATYRLPSEAEWEYAARAGTIFARYWGEEAGDPGQHAWFNVRGGTHAVGSFPANGFGLHDMLGNVWETTADHWHDDYNDAPADGSAWAAAAAAIRVVRGGSGAATRGTCARRPAAGTARRDRGGALGFRCARVQV